MVFIGGFLFLVSRRWKGAGAFPSSTVHSSGDSNAASRQSGPINRSVQLFALLLPISTA